MDVTHSRLSNFPFSSGPSTSEFPHCTIIREYPLFWSSFWTPGRSTASTNPSNLVVPTVTKTVPDAESILLVSRHLTWLLLVLLKVQGREKEEAQRPHSCIRILFITSAAARDRNHKLIISHIIPKHSSQPRSRSYIRSMSLNRSQSLP